MAEPALAEQPLQVHPLTPTVGAEVAGIDLAENLGDGTIAWLSDQLVERKVLFFREQRISSFLEPKALRHREEPPRLAGLRAVRLHQATVFRKHRQHGEGGNELP